MARAFSVITSTRARLGTVSGAVVLSLILLLMLWTLIVVLVILWLLGFNLNIGGDLIHALLVIALIVLIINLLS